MPPKAAMKDDQLLRYQYRLARELGMTHARLVQELAPGEIAFQMAYDELEMERPTRKTWRRGSGDPLIQ